MKTSNRFLMASLLFVVALGAASAQGAPRVAAPCMEAPYKATIRVTGEATATVDADMAVLALGIVQQAKTPLAVREAVTAAADRVIGSLVALGIEKKQIRTSNFSIRPVYDERPGKQSLIVGYRADASITVTLDNTGLVAEAVEAAVGAGTNEIRSLTYKKKNEDALRVETLKKAVANAAGKAAAMAEVLGRKLGKAITVEEQGYAMRAPDTRMYMAKAAGANSEEAFSPGSIEVSASVVVVFEME
jgi:uncharacterized protein YggE